MLALFGQQLIACGSQLCLVLPQDRQVAKASRIDQAIDHEQNENDREN